MHRTNFLYKPETIPAVMRLLLLCTALILPLRAYAGGSINSVTIAGNFQSKIGCSADWAPDCPGTGMTYNSALKRWVVTLTIPAGNWEYKVAINNSLEESYGAAGTRGGPGYSVMLGSPTVMAFAYNPETHLVTTLLVPVLEATMRDSVIPDLDNDGKAVPGETIHYTVTIANSGALDATGVTFDNTPDLNTTIVPGSIKTTPLARDDQYTANNVTPLNVAAPGVLTNDNDPDGSSGLAVIAHSNVATTQGGLVTLNSDGSFTYNAPSSSYTGTDDFTYTIQDADGNTNDATVTITVNYLDNAPYVTNVSPANGATGVSTSPTITVTFSEPVYFSGPAATLIGSNSGSHTLSSSFNSPTEVEFDLAANASPLDNNETVTFTVIATDVYDQDLVDPPNYMAANFVSTFTTVGLPLTAGTDNYSGVGNTQIQVAAAQSVTTPAVFVSGSVLDNDTAGNGPGPLTVTTTGNIATTAGGTVNMNANGSFVYTPPVDLAGANADGFQYTVSDGLGTANGTVNISLSNMVWYIDNSAPSGGDGRSNTPFNSLGAFVFVNNGNTGNPSDNDYVFLAENGGGDYNGVISLRNGQKLFGEGVGLTVGPLTIPAGGTPQIINTSGITQGMAILLAADNTIRGLNVGNTPANYGIIANANVGVLTISDVNISGTGGAISLPNGSNANTGITFGSLSSSGSADDGINLHGFNGTFTVSTSTSISNTTSIGIDIQNSVGSSSFNFGSTTLTSIGTTGINLSSSNSATFTFSSLSVTTSNGTGLFANNSGTINIGGTTNTISATGGAGLNITSTSFGSGTTFSSVSANNSTANGINLNNVTGGLTIKGGTIQNSVDHAVKLNTVNNLTLSGMTINAVTNKNAVDANSATNLIFDQCSVTGGSGNSYAFFGNSIRNLTIRNQSVFDGGGGSVSNIDGVRITNLLGTSEFNNSTFRKGKDINVLIENTITSGNPDILNIVNGTTFSNSAGGDHLQVETDGSANLQLNVNNGGGSNVVFSGTGQDAIQLEGEGNSTFTANITQATITGNLGSAVNLATVVNGNLTATVQGLTGLASNGTNVINMIAFDNSTLTASILNNSITSATAGNGIRSILEGNGTVTANISGNIVSGITQGSGIICQARAGTSGNMNLTIGNNNVTTTGALSLDGIEVTAGSSGGGDQQTICLNLLNNNSTSGAYDGYFLRNRAGNTFLLKDFAANGSSIADITNWVNSVKNNTGSVFASIGSAFGSSSGCATP